MAGRIWIDRDIVNHWIWGKPEYFQWWCDLLFMASWRDEKKLVGSRIVSLKRGQLVASLSFLVKRWKRGKDMIIDFLKLLQEEDMINKTTAHRIPTITITNYDKYQLADNSADNLNSNVSNNYNVPFPQNADKFTDKLADTNRINNNNLVVVDNNAREEFLKSVCTQLRIEQGCMSMGISPEQYQQLAKEVVSDWAFTEEQDWSLKHFLSTMRIKARELRKQNGNQTNHEPNPLSRVKVYRSIG